MKSKKLDKEYLDMVGFTTPEEAYKKIKEWVSDLSDQDHLIRSTIFDIHAGIELELRRIFYHHNKSLLFLTGKEKEDAVVLRDFEKMVDKLNFGDISRILKPILIHWYPDLENIEEINKLRNQVAHKANIEDISYRGRNPFKDADSFAQVFVDAWVIKQCLPKFFDKAIEGPKARCEEYYKAYEKYVLGKKDVE
jgi:DNA-directed RNA polymerase subunit F